MSPLARALPIAFTALLLSPLTLADNAQLERGRYLLQISGCNDCHTSGYLMAPGKVAESDWLKGDNLGWYGPWGTTYPSNLRLVLPKLSESQWLTMARSANYRPPMPNLTLQRMTDEDLLAIYQLVKHLGPAGEPAPMALPPGDMPEGPVVMFPMPPAKPQ
ncbi:cytochrome C [Pseudomonas sp. MAP12]|uniref:Cytochrome C n=1 Tax=Geopseudomonas aromaticivorans TaxID=2849492 RepID=A0ABS6MW91_9GAMM|nr:cytochrome C [Pseudomonas aromaticivorans]MBV2133070.1 cytochrome C [Pseudomonas aromaticivorans]